MSSRILTFRALSAPSDGKTCRCCWTRGIDVLTTMNVQHLESLNDQIWQITGIRVRETIPDWVMKQAAEVVMVDVTPRALLNPLGTRRGVFAREGAQRRWITSFANPRLRALRELAMRQTAHEVDVRQTGEKQPPERSDHWRPRRGRRGTTNAYSSTSQPTHPRPP